MKKLLSLVVLMGGMNGCAALAAGVVGSQAWFQKNHEPELKTKAATDLACTDQPIEFKAVSLDDFREVDAVGCGKTARYTLIKVGPVENWKKSS